MNISFIDVGVGVFCFVFYYEYIGFVVLIKLDIDFGFLVRSVILLMFFSFEIIIFDIFY